MAQSRSVVGMPGLEQGSHLCCLYSSDEDYWATLTPFLRQGLEWREKVIHITDSRPVDSVLERLRDCGLDVEPHLTSGQMLVSNCDDVYLQGGSFDPSGVVALFQQETVQALAEGYQGLRVNGEMCWMLWEPSGWEQLTDYETLLNQSLPGSRCLALCQYDERLFDPAILLDVLRTHSAVIIDAEVFDNFYYAPPAQSLPGDHSAEVLERWVENIVGRKRAEEALRRVHEELEMRVEERTAELAQANEGLYAEITERERAQDALGRRAVQLALLNDIGGKIAAVLELDAVLDRTARLVQESFGYHHVALFAVDQERRDLIMKARAGEFADLFPPEHRLELGQGMVGWVGESGERLLANDVDAEPRYVNLYPDVVPTHSELSVPIRVGRAIVGVLDVQSPEPNAFDENDVMVMETLADQIATAMHNARLYAAVRQELAERHRIGDYVLRTERLTAMGHTAAALSQEIQDPLQSIRSHLKSALDSKLKPKKRQEHLRGCSEEVEQLTEISERVLNLARPTVDGPCPTSVAELVQRALDMLCKPLHRARIEAAVDVAADLPAVSVVPDQMVQVLLNLILNSIEAMPHGGHVRITAEADANTVALSLTNDGPPIPEEHVEHVFDPFFTTKPQGIGLGLFISSNAVRQHGGTISVRNLEDGQGVQFILVLPVAGPADGNGKAE